MTSFIPPLDIPPGATPFEDPERVAAIKRWFAEVLKLPEDAVVLVSETTCQDPTCPLVETVVGVFEDKRTRKWRFTRPRNTVVRMMVAFAIASNPDGVG